MKKLLLLLIFPFCLNAQTVVTYTDWSTDPQVFQSVKDIPKEKSHFGSGSTPVYALDAEFHPAWQVSTSDTNYLKYVSLRGYTDLSSQINSNPNAINLSIQTNMRYKNNLNRSWFRYPETNSDIVGSEYDYYTQTLNYFSGGDLLEPIAVLKQGTFVLKGGIGVISGKHLRMDNKTSSNPIMRMTFRGQSFIQTNHGLTISSKWKLAMPIYDEPEIFSNGTSIKPTEICTSKPRNYVKTTIAQKLNSYTSLTITESVGKLPPSFWKVKNNVIIGFQFTTGSGKSE